MPSCLDSVAAVCGGGDRDRTDDPLLAKQVLSQLSYTPLCADQPGPGVHPPRAHVSCLKGACLPVVGLVGFEPTTPALSRRCSNRLSYRPAFEVSSNSKLPVPGLPCRARPRGLRHTLTQPCNNR